MTEIVDKIELSTSTIYLDNEGLLRVEYKDNCEMGMEEAKLHVEACCKLCDGRLTCFIIDSRNITALITPEARKFLANNSEILKVRKAHAIIVDSLPNRLIANFYFKFNKPKGPGKVFNSENAALDWLIKYK